MKLISWNIRAGGGDRRTRQLEALKERGPDIVALQEITPDAAAIYRNGLADLGLMYVADSFDLLKDQVLWTGSRKYGVMLASRWPFKNKPQCNVSLPWPERTLWGTIVSPGGEIEIITTHIPVGSHGYEVKIVTLEGIFNALVNMAGNRILCGDLNTPKKEFSDGRVMTYGQAEDSDGQLITGQRWEAWDAGERNVLQGLAKYGMEDIYRKLNSYEAVDFSWYDNSGQKGYRIDHIIASSSLHFTACKYIHEWRDTGLSDHSAIEATFTFDPL